MGDDAEWTACLTAVGLSVQVQAAILNPLCNEDRFNKTALFCARITIEMRYADLRLRL